MAKGDGFHVKKADVHLGLDVYPLPDLEWTEQREGLALTAQVLDPPTPPPTPATNGEAPGGESQWAAS